MDLCEPCGLRLRVALNRLYGQPKATGKSGKTKALCPKCQVVLSSRSAVIGHLVGQHGMDKVSASLIVPTNGTRVQVHCTHCGYLTTKGPGYVKHVVNDHPEG